MSYRGKFLCVLFTKKPLKFTKRYLDKVQRLLVMALYLFLFVATLYAYYVAISSKVTKPPHNDASHFKRGVLKAKLTYSGSRSLNEGSYPKIFRYPIGYVSQIYGLRLYLAIANRANYANFLFTISIMYYIIDLDKKKGGANMTIVYKTRTVDGVTYYSFYLIQPNGKNYIAIRNSFKDDYHRLVGLAQSGYIVSFDDYVTGAHLLKTDKK